MLGGCGGSSGILQHPVKSTCGHSSPKSCRSLHCKVIDGHISSVRVISKSLSLQAERLAAVGDSGGVVFTMGSLGDGRLGPVLHSCQLAIPALTPGYSTQFPT
ncbi:hypothetical protein HGM15179_010105 [Zosterops borbonicus]|uniref:Uncharacterized protein n=1 Tax=Zosterops borbonicus TaxID=364589 RepID=A0A8K1LKH5_9PASS|nr:hypothetical protein HGM15179_010105 [Zosterops borbonicus]